MSTLVTLEDFKEYVGYSATDKDLILGGKLDAIEEYLAKVTDQTFAAAGTVADEVQSGTGHNDLLLRRPATSITAIKVSAASDPSDVDETIPTTDVRIDPANDRRLVRFQNGVFPAGTFNVLVSYEAKTNLTSLNKEAVKAGAAMLWRLRGSEHVQAQSLGELGSETLVEVARRLWNLPEWRAAVEQGQEPAMVLA